MWQVGIDFSIFCCFWIHLNWNLRRCSHLLSEPENLVDRPSPHSFSHMRWIWPTHPLLHLKIASKGCHCLGRVTSEWTSLWTRATSTSGLSAFRTRRALGTAIGRCRKKHSNMVLSFKCNMFSLLFQQFWKLWQRVETHGIPVIPGESATAPSVAVLLAGSGKKMSS